MPILQRIELSNFMNTGRVKPWRPDWVHQILEINGENAALNIPNGRGKSTMVTAILAMLAYHSKSLKDIRMRFFAPVQTGHYTHIRIQVLIPTPGAGGDLVAMSGGDLGGQPMVFGMYGNSGDNEKLELYAYQGVFEDAPVAHVHNLHHTFVSDDAFLSQMRTCSHLFPSNAKERTKRAWQSFVADFFDVSSLNQQLVYQLARGAEGGHGYFEVTPPVGMDYSAAVFYERLAPELLTDVMGDFGEENEHGIEDTIHEKVSKVIAAKRETARKTEELRRTENTLKALAGLLEASADQKAAKVGYDQHRAEFSLELAVLQNVVVDAPIPGVPAVPPETVPEIARSMVMQDGKWYLPDRVMAEFTGEPASDVNRRAQERNGIQLQTASKSQLIDFACHLASPQRKGGHSSQLYSRDAAVALLNISTNFARDWAREKAVEVITQAFDWVEAHADTNPARALKVQLEAELTEKSGERGTLSDQFKEHQREKEELVAEQTQVGAQQAEYRRMATSGLFSEDELKSPATTGTAVHSALQVSQKALDDHKSMVFRLGAVHDAWKDFVREHGESARPASLADTIEETVKAAKLSVQATQQSLGVARERRKQLGNDLRRATERHKAIDGRLGRYLETLPAFSSFIELFGHISPVGLEKKVVDELNTASRRLSTITNDRDRYRSSLQALATFRTAHGEVSPEEWLKQELGAWEDLGAEIGSLTTSVNEEKRRRTALDKSVVVAGRVARDAAVAAGGNHEPLHSAIARMDLGAERSEKVLTLFSALLHTPVYSNVSDAADAARRLETAGIEAPVFVYPELEAFCRAGDISLDAVSSHTWLVGVRTRQVDCLLDPTLVEREKALANERIQTLTLEIEGKTLKRNEHSPQGQAAAQARQAMEAVENGYEAKDAELKKEADIIAGRLPTLETRASSVETIRLAERHVKEFDGVAEADLRNEHESCRKAMQLADEQQEANDASITELEAKLDEQHTLLSHAAINESKVNTLREIQLFIDAPKLNPAYMGAALETEKVLTQARNLADERSRFQFDLAETFIRQSHDRPRQIEERLKHLTEEQEEISKRLLPVLDKRIEELQNDIPDLIKQIIGIDDFVRSLIRQYREFASEQQHEPVSVTQKQIETHPLGGAAIGLRDCGASLKDRAKMFMDIADEIQFDETSGLKAEMNASRTRYFAAKRDFGRMVDNIFLMDNLDMTEYVKLELARAKDEPDIIVHLHAVANQNYEKNSQANATAAAYLEKEWANIGDWLKSFTQRLPDNLRTMKEVFAPLKDKEHGKYLGAGFEIDAKLASQDDIKVILDDVVKMVERFEATRLAVENAAPSIRDQAVRSIRAEIRNTFYQKVILAPRIRAYMPSISPHPLVLEKNMVSTGQGVAMTLLWIIKMADYVTARELNRLSTSRAKQRRLHPTQFAIMDGAFSSLSNKNLIRDALNSISRTRGRFQLIITGHDENYQNNFEYFPTLVEARVVDGQFMYADSKTRRIFQPEEVGSHYGSMAVMGLRVTPTPDVVSTS